MSKRSALVGLVLVALCAFLVLPVWAVEPGSVTSGSGSLTFERNNVSLPDLTISGFSSSSGFNGTFTQAQFTNGTLPFWYQQGSVPLLFDTVGSHSVLMSFTGNSTIHCFVFYTVDSFPLTSFNGYFSPSVSLYQRPSARVGGNIYTRNPSNFSQYYSVSNSSVTVYANEANFVVYGSSPGQSVSGKSFSFDSASLTNVSLNDTLYIDFVPVSFAIDFSIQLDSSYKIDYLFPSNAYDVGSRWYNFAPIGNYDFHGVNGQNDFATRSCLYLYPRVENDEFGVNGDSGYSFVVSGGSGGDSPDYTSLLNMIISKLDLIIQNMANSGSTDLSGVESRLDTIIQNLGEVSPMADFEDSYIQNFGGQLEGVESSLSGKDSSLPSGGDMTGFTGALQSSLGIDSAGFSQADFDSAVSSLGGDKIDEGMPWYFFTQAVADSMVTPPSGFSVYSDVSPSDTWVSDSERWRRLWSTPY